MVFLFCFGRITKADELSELKAQIQRIQEKNKIQQEQLNEQSKVIKRLLEEIEALESKDEVLLKEVESLKQKPRELVLEEETELTGLISIPELKIKGFSDIGFSAKITDSEGSNKFSLGGMDLFITSEITDMVSFLAESHFQFNTDTNSSDFHLARVSLKYSLSNLFNIKIGRMHTPLGYWNQAYHHGTWFQTTAFRPQIYKFEGDDGGFLPVHSVGIELLGTKEFDGFDLEYNFDVINGRGRTKDEIQNIKDNNDSKAINLLLSIKPHFIEGLKLGANVYYDRIPSNPSVSTRTNRIDELILGGYLIYIHDRVELLGEYFNIYHDDKTSGNDFDTLGFYLQAGYKIDKFTPYYRFDFIDFENGDPYFTPDDIDIKKHTLGLKWDIFCWNALKFEYSFSDKRDRNNEHSLTVNSSFVF
jgi:hypothetical protein